MTEAEWLTCTDPTLMLMKLPCTASDRKARLFGVASCRRVCHLLTDPRSWKAIDVAEQYAEGTVSEETLSHACSMANQALEELGTIETVPDKELLAWQAKAGAASAVHWLVDSGQPHGYVTRRAAEQAANLAAQAVADHVLPCGYYNENRDQWLAIRTAEQSVQVVFLRDIFGNPFCPVNTNRSWLMPDVLTLAQAIYDQLAFDRLPVLADSLEEAGCTNTGILDHCRQPGEHVRGCWVVDLLLGKE